MGDRAETRRKTVKGSGGHSDFLRAFALTTSSKNRSLLEQLSQTLQKSRIAKRTKLKCLLYRSQERVELTTHGLTARQGKRIRGVGSIVLQIILQGNRWKEHICTISDSVQSKQESYFFSFKRAIANSSKVHFENRQKQWRVKNKKAGTYIYIV